MLRLSPLTELLDNNGKCEIWFIIMMAQPFNDLFKDRWIGDQVLELTPLDYHLRRHMKTRDYSVMSQTTNEVIERLMKGVN